MAISQAIFSEAQVQSYWDNGYLLPEQDLFTPEKFTRLQTIFEELLAERGPNGLDVIHFDNPQLMEFLMDEHVLDVVETIIGPDFGLFSSHFISKEPGIGRATPWHEDSGYWNGRFENFTGIVTIWLAIDPSSRENGCMRVIPGSHKMGGNSDYSPVDNPEENIFGTEIKNGFDEEDAVYFTLKPNHFSMHDSRIIHGAEANTSATRRCGYTMRYFSQDMKYVTEGGKNDKHKIWHCRGQNPHNNPVEN